MLQIENLSKTYSNGVKALDNIKLNLQKGVFGLLGPNGAGKSSLMRTIATLQQPDTGMIHFDGIDVLKKPDDLRLTLGYLPQEFGVYPRISAFDLLNHLAVLKGLTNKKQRVESVNSLLNQVNLYQDRNKSVHSFSGGMKQRFGVAQALLGDPKLIIVDEPTAGLDPVERNRFNNLLADIGQNKVVILSTHIVDDVEELCSQFAILVNGQVRVFGTPSDYIIALENTIWQKSIAKNELASLSQQYKVISNKLKAGQTIVHVESEQDLTEQGFTNIPANLHDVYFATLHQANQAKEG